MANFKDGVIRDSSTIGVGVTIGSIKDGRIRDRLGKALGTADSGVIRDSLGKRLGEVRGANVYNSSGKNLGKVADYMIRGMEREYDYEIVAAYHFLIKKFL